GTPVGEAGVTPGTDDGAVTVDATTGLDASSEDASDTDASDAGSLDASSDAQDDCLSKCDGGTCEDGRCTYRCATAASCTAPITCPPGIPCTVECTGINSCAKGIDCTKASECSLT